MAFTSTLSIYSHLQPQLGLRQNRSQYLAVTAVQFVWLPPLKSRRTFALGVSSRSFVVRAGSSVEGTSARASGSRRVYRESQANATLSVATVKQIATAVAPFGVILAVTFVIWKLAGKLLAPTPKQSKSPAAESQSSSQGLKWSFAAGTNLLSQLGVKIEKQSQQKLNEFAQELRAFPFVDMSGRSFGDEGLFFLAESLAFNQLLGGTKGYLVIESILA